MMTCTHENHLVVAQAHRGHIPTKNCPVEFIIPAFWDGIMYEICPAYHSKPQHNMKTPVAPALIRSPPDVVNETGNL